MQVTVVLKNMALGIAGLSVLIALIGLWHEFTEPGGAHELIHNLETWLVTAGYHAALIVLAAAGVLYLLRKQ
jgi:hypothetical protein